MFLEACTINTHLVFKLLSSLTFYVMFINRFIEKILYILL
jgi:hypothetical protein